MVCSHKQSPENPPGIMWRVKLSQGDLALAQVTLYQPDELLHDRIADSSVLTGLIQSIVAVAASEARSGAWAAAPGAFVGVIASPAGRLFAACEAVGSDVPSDDTDRLTSALENVPCPVVTGAVAFGLELARPSSQGLAFPQFPKDWVETTRRGGQPVAMPDGLLALLESE
jgi:hypothetical protein